jgi:hypothetical protein
MWSCLGVDRLGRSLARRPDRHAARSESANVDLFLHHQAIDTTTAGRMFHVMGAPPSSSGI